MKDISLEKLRLYVPIFVGVVIILILLVTSISFMLFKGESKEKPPEKLDEQYEFNPVENPREIREKLILSVTGVEPRDGQKEISTNPTIKIYFDKPHDSKDIKFVTKPAFKFKIDTARSNLLYTLTPTSALKPSTKYTVDVLHQGLKIFFWSFTTGKKATVEASLVEKIKSQLPYQESHVYITYLSSADKFFVTIDAKPVNTYKTRALNWFKSQGLVDPESQINITFLLTGTAANR